MSPASPGGLTSPVSAHPRRLLLLAAKDDVRRPAYSEPGNGDRQGRLPSPQLRQSKAHGIVDKSNRSSPLGKRAAGGEDNDASAPFHADKPCYPLLVNRCKP